MKRPEAFKHARVAALAADEKQGEEILVIDVRDESSVADCFVFVTGTTHVHVRALEDAVRQSLAASGARLLRTDGQRGHLWRALDYGSLIVHIMDKKTREFYGMERLWDTRKMIDWEPAKPEPKKRVPRKKKARA